jgi:hypothetical protein
MMTSALLIMDIQPPTLSMAHPLRTATQWRELKKCIETFRARSVYVCHRWLPVTPMAHNLGCHLSLPRTCVSFTGLTPRVPSALVKETLGQPILLTE